MKRNGWMALTFHTLFLIFMMGPIVAVCLVAFTNQGYLSLPTKGISLRWFYAIADYPEFFQAAQTSVMLGTISSILVLLFSVPAALAIARYRFVGRNALANLLMSPLMIPQAVLGIAFLRFFTEIGLAGSWTGLIIAHLIIVMPFALRLTLAAAVGIDGRQEQAAISLGADGWTVFRRIVWPMILPGVLSGWILSFIQSFDEVTMTIFIATPGTETLPVRMFLYIQDNIDPLVASVSAAVIALTAILLVVLDRLFGLEALMLGRSSEH